MKKKFLFLTFIAIAITIAILTIKGHAVSVIDQFYVDGKIDGLWTVREEANGTKHIERARIIRRRSDNKLAYCVEPFQDLIDDLAVTGITENQAIVLNLSEADWNRIELLSYYGYGYKNHTDISWYSITQELIWRTVFPDGRFYYIHIEDNSEWKDKFASEINELEDLVSNHYKAPQFGANKFNAIINQELVLTDNNGVLSNYDVVENSNVIIEKNGNQLVIIPKTVGNIELVLEKKDKLLSTPTILYPDSSSQDVMVTGMLDPVIVKLNINVTGGKVTIHKVDSETGENIAGSLESTLSGAKYGVFDLNGNLITELITGEDGTIQSDYLPYIGKYTIQELEASLGYEIDKTNYEFEITTENLFPDVTVYEQIIKRPIKIGKFFAKDDTGQLVPEKGVIFKFFDIDNQEVASIETDEDGYAELDLPYGHYIGKQITTTENHEKVDDFEITIDENSLEVIRLSFSNAPIKAKLKVIKIDSETKEVIKRSNIKFKIYDVKNEEYVCQTISYPYFKQVCEYETDENGIFYTPKELMAGTYRLEEVDQRIDGYTWNQTSKEFTIDENSELIEEEVGVIFETEFENKQSKGYIKIFKTGEEFVIENGSFRYEKIALANVEFEIRANEDIVVNGYKYFEKGDIVNIITTDENGYAELKDLPLGKYLLHEKSTDENHVLDIKDYEFELQYQDQYTEIVFKEFDIENVYKKGTLDFTKVDLTDGTPISNVEIKIYTEDEELIYTGITDENGKIVITDLPVGKPMYIIETRAADNYQITEEKVFFEIRENGEIVKASLSNEKIDVPDTGMYDNHLTEIVGSLLILFGIGAIVYAKKKKN